MAVTEGLPGEDRDGVMMIEGRVLKPGDKIHDLLDVQRGAIDFPGEALSGGRPRPEKIYDLVDVVEKRPRMAAFVDTGLRDEIMKRAAEIAEKVAREVIPDVAERVLREEIERLKKNV